MKTPDTITVEGKVRYYLGKVEKDIWELAVKTVTADLRAKVEALEEHIVERGDLWVRRDDVLAIFDGTSDE